MNGSTRRLRNYVLRPLLQFKLGLFQVIFAIIFALIVVAIFQWQFHEAYDTILDLTDLREDVSRLLGEQLRSAIAWLVGTSILFVLGSLVLAVFYTHRLIGPTIAFNRHLEALLRGDASAKTTLRKHDAFQETAALLNALSDHMQQKSQRD